MIHVPGNPARTGIAPEFIVANVIAVRGWEQQIRTGLYVGPREDFRYDVKLRSARGVRIFRDLQSVGPGYTRSPWCYAHPPRPDPDSETVDKSSEVWGRCIGEDYVFQFIDFLPYVGPCPGR